MAVQSSPSGAPEPSKLLFFGFPRKNSATDHQFHVLWEDWPSSRACLCKSEVVPSYETTSHRVHRTQPEVWSWWRWIMVGMFQEREEIVVSAHPGRNQLEKQFFKRVLSEISDVSRMWSMYLWRCCLLASTDISVIQKSSYDHWWYGDMEIGSFQRCFISIRNDSVGLAAKIQRTSSWRFLAAVITTVVNGQAWALASRYEVLSIKCRHVNMDIGRKREAGIPSSKWLDSWLHLEKHSRCCSHFYRLDCTAIFERETDY